MGCLKLTYYQEPELKVVHSKKELNSKISSKSLRSNHQFLFGGKELQDEMGLDVYDFIGRTYDHLTGKFWQIDPHAEKYYGWSQYAYCMNNPLRFIDPNGADGDVEINKDRIRIQVQIYIYGSGANDKQASKMQETIMNDWKGFSYTDSKTGEKYAVNFDVHVQLYDKDNPTEAPGVFSGKNNPFSTGNFIEVGANTKDVARSFVEGGDEGKWRGYGTDPSSHEFGHLIGLKDHYSDGKGVEAGWKGNIMAEPAGQGKVEQKNIDAVAHPLINQYQNTNQYKNAQKYQTKINESLPKW